MRMQIFQKLSILVLLQVVGCSSHELTEQSLSNYKSFKGNTHKLNPQKISDITLHGVLLWASMGFLMPVGILTIRMSTKEENPTRIRLIFYVHVILQILSVLLATAGAVLSINSFENSFNNNHQRIGLVLYGAIWVQALIGFCRPHRGKKGRSIWYFVHWILGTTISLMGIINIYTGLKAYRERTSRSVTLWIILLTSEIAFIALFYLFQDKWEYMQKQGEISDSRESAIASNQVIPQSNKNLVLLREPCRKSNAHT